MILTRNEAIGRLNKVVLAPATGTIRGLDTEVELGAEDGMPQSCVLNLANTSSAEKAMLSGPVTTLGAEKMDAVCRALVTATSCG